MGMESNIWIKRTAISLAVTSALFSQTLIAKEQSEQLERVVITGQKSSPLDIEIDQDALDNMQAKDLDDIFSKQAEVSVGGGTSISQKIYVRGLEDTMLNVTIDGATQAGNMFHHQGRISIEPELLKRVEVQAGAGDATAGPGALGGAIKFITKDPEDLLNEGEKFGALLKGGYYTNANAYKTSVSLYGSMSDTWSAMATIIQTAGDNYTDGFGDEQQYTDFDQQNALIKLVGNFSNNQRLSFSYDGRIDDGEKLTRAHWVPSVKNKPIDQEANRKTGTIKYSIDPTNNQWLALDSSVYYTDNSITQDGSYGIYEGAVESYGLNVENTSLVNDHSFTYGLDYRNDSAGLYNHSDPSIKTDTDEGDVYGVYLQANIFLTNAWALSVGSRYDVYKLTDTIEQKFDSSGFSPNASLIFTPLDTLKLQLGYAQAMRGVQTKETFVLDYYQNDPDRKEETAENIEFSVDYQLFDIGLSAKFYHSTIDDVVSTMNNAAPAGSSSVIGNVGELVTQGYSLAAGYNWQDLQTSLTFNSNTSELNGEPLSDDTWGLGTSMGDSFVADVNYQATSSIELGWTGKFVTRLTDVAEGYSEGYFGEKPGYAVHDIYGKWLPLNSDDLKVTLSINNLFDKGYRDHASYGNYGEVAQGTTEPGRDFRINVAWAL